MDAGDLRIFEAVARLGGMNRAAAELNTVQSNVTARIRLLEAQLGQTLFRRHSRGVALTAAGRGLAEELADVPARVTAASGLTEGEQDDLVARLHDLAGALQAGTDR